MSGSEIDGKSGGKRSFKRTKNFLLNMYRAGRNGCSMLADKYRGKLNDLGLTDEEIFEELDRLAGA
ncbi:MAG: hypothetical protein HGB08_00870 [Candidatus Moranbacteria bacterium]|nr:hypothetical protein [Candidatus Moranbacteria bacterium]